MRNCSFTSIVTGSGTGKEATVRERLAVAVAMWPRGEVGAGVLLVSLAYGIGGPVLTVAMLSLALNISLTGVFILIVKRLLAAHISIAFRLEHQLQALSLLPLLQRHLDCHVYSLPQPLCGCLDGLHSLPNAMAGVWITR